MILSTIETRVAARNRINAERMRAGNTIPADKIFARGGVVSLFIPKSMRLAGELRRVYYRVVQHTRGGYQLISRYGLISGRYQHNQLNGVDQDMPDIPRMTVMEARNAPKVTFPKIIADMNNRQAVSAEQRAGRGRREQAMAEGEARREAVAARRRARSTTGDEIEVDRPATRRRRAASSSPSAGPSARNTAKRGGGGLY